MENINNLPSISNLPQNAEHSGFLDLPKDTSCLRLLDLPKNAEHSGFLDLPEEMINEIILLVPLIDLFRVSRVCRIFKQVAYKRRSPIINRAQYNQAALDGDILSLLYTGEKKFKSHIQGVRHCKSGIQEACKSGHLDIVKFMYNKYKCDIHMGFYYAAYLGHIHIVQYLLPRLTINRNKYICASFLEACSRGYYEIVKILQPKLPPRRYKCIAKGLERARVNNYMQIVDLIDIIWLNSELSAACRKYHMFGGSGYRCQSLAGEMGHRFYKASLSLSGITECYYCYLPINMHTSETFYYKVRA